MCCFFFEIMKQLNKGFNVVKNIVGSSYIIEIDELSKKYQNTLIILDNNHQIDALYNELSRLYRSKKILKFPNYGLDDYSSVAIDKDIIKDRYECLIELSHNADNKIIITSCRSIFYKTRVGISVLGDLVLDVSFICYPLFIKYLGWKEPNSAVQDYIISFQ